MLKNVKWFQIQTRSITKEHIKRYKEILRVRAGVAEAIQFAKRTLHIYRMAVKKNSRGIRSGYGSTYRRSLVLSCLVFRSYIRMMMGNLSGVA